jgi:hypothetical protein
VPTVATVEGVKIQFYPDDHPPPHFHAEFAEYRAKFDIASLSITRGFLPIPKRRAVIEWASSRQDVLSDMFARAIANERLERLK